ncbi:phage N-6-adenine-methyltransferase [Rouxiella badensis]|uniref:phage N-6-adenine-methyltransferase n=1 Tax=Rouxiella badensis TaxID=1646377 RepID=UPI001D13C4FF|nr:phage N-6-adenine-methyltransferase [Rouxiella badensis]MCC3745300.1 phage N-6-adenine-methyltransferase [Rouxiella badensis]
MNAYIQVLNEQKALPAHMLKDVGDQWRTPESLFWGINAMFGPLVLDLFTDGENSKCPAYYTVDDNALIQDWSARLAGLNGAAFGNPPYSRPAQHDGVDITGMVQIMKHAQKMRDFGGRYVFLIKAATSETWWPENADHVAFIRGRVGFDAPLWFKPADKKQVPTGAFFAGAIVVFDKTWRGEKMSYISRTALETQGELFIAQIRREAEKLATQITPQNIPEIIPQKETTSDTLEKVLPLKKQEIIEKSGVSTWACAAAAFGDKPEFSFNESRYAHSWADDSFENPSFVVVSPEIINKAIGYRNAHLHEVDLREWIRTDFFSQDISEDVLQRLNIVVAEIGVEPGFCMANFLSVIGKFEVESFSNIRVLRRKVADSLPEILNQGQEENA